MSILDHLNVLIYSIEGFNIPSVFHDCYCPIHGNNLWPQIKHFGQ